MGANTLPRSSIPQATCLASISNPDSQRKKDLLLDLETGSHEEAPLVRAIVNALSTCGTGSLHERFFLDLLRRGSSEEEARARLDIAIDWGRYVELIDFDANTGELRLEMLLSTRTDSRGLRSRPDRVPSRFVPDGRWPEERSCRRGQPVRGLKLAWATSCQRLPLHSKTERRGAGPGV
jgi:C-terminal AAA-associated domain